MNDTNDNTTGRFTIAETPDGKYRVIDSGSGLPLRYSYDRGSIPTDGTPDEWNNFYCARNFAQKMARIHS